MKTKFCILIFFFIAAVSHAETNSLTGLLQRGLLEEQANRNLEAAIANYQALIGQFDKDRHIASTAIFRLGECYRMLGRTNEAAAEYRRLLKDFPEENPLTTLSKENLVGMGFTVSQGISTFQSNLRKIQPGEPNPGPVANEEDAQIQRLREMVQNSPDLINIGSETDQANPTPLCQAASKGQLRVAQFLLTNGADINVASFNRTPLEYAVTHGQNAMVEFLLNHGAAFGSRALEEAAEHGYKVVAESLLAHHADINPSDGGYSALEGAAQGSHLSVVQLLLAHGADVNNKDGQGRTALSLAAARNNNSKVVKALLDAHANPNDSESDAPLLGAIYVHDTASAKLLLEAGANPNAKGKISWESSHIGGWDGRVAAPLYHAIYTRQLPMVRLLLKFKADPNHSQISDQPLIVQALDDTNILLALIEGGANVDAVDPGYDSYNLFLEASPLEIAVGDNNASAVDILLKHRADPNERDEKGNTALHYAAEPFPADEYIFKLLLDHKANPNIPNQDGKTPLDVLKINYSGIFFRRHNGVRNETETKKNALELINLLRQHGALDNLPNWNAIVASRPSTGFSRTVFQKGTNDWNHFTLLELIFDLEEFQDGPPFADLAHLAVLHPNPQGGDPKRIAVSLVDSTNGIDFAKDIPLDFGDTVEIPELEHTLADVPRYLPANQDDEMRKFFRSHAGEAKLIVEGGSTVQLPIQPMFCQIGSILQNRGAQTALTSNSDLSRVKIIRRNADTGKADELVLNCSRMNRAPDLWVRNGDVIEVPLKR